MAEIYRQLKDSFETNAGTLFKANGGKDGVRFFILNPEVAYIEGRGKPGWVVRQTLEAATDWFEPLYTLGDLYLTEADLACVTELLRP